MRESKQIRQSPAIAEKSSLSAFAVLRPDRRQLPDRRSTGRGGRRDTDAAQELQSSARDEASGSRAEPGSEAEPACAVCYS